MSAFLTLWRRELGSYFCSPIAYVTIIFFLVVMGFSFWFLAILLSQGAESVSVMRVLFGESLFFWIAMLIVVPVITMRLFAEEKRSGTIETLMTAPVSDEAVVLAKYFGALSFFLIMWLPTATYAFILKKFTPLLPVDLGPMFTSYIGAFLVGGFYISIGLFASSFTKNQILAAIVCFTFISVAFFSGFIPYFVRDAALQDVANYVSSVEHMREFSQGIVDTRPIVFYLTSTMVVLFATVRVIESRKWK